MFYFMRVSIKLDARAHLSVTLIFNFGNGKIYLVSVRGVAKISTPFISTPSISTSFICT